MKLVPITHEAHGAKKVRPVTSHAFARTSSVLPLYAAELGRAATEFPICFTQLPEGFFPGALMGIEPANNLFVGPDGQWLAGYLPAVLRRGPFALARVENSDNWVLCLDESSDLVSESEGLPLFGEDGQTTPFLAQVTTLLGDLERNRIVTLAACDALAAHQILEPWELRIDDGNNNIRKLEGLFRISEEKLNSVDGEALLDLRNRGALMVAYAHLFSLAKLQVIGLLAGRQAQLLGQKNSLQRNDINLDHIFGVADDDPFLFDFSQK